MSITISGVSRRLPGWGTCLAGLFTFILLCRMQHFYATADLAYIAASFILELILIELVTQLALGIRSYLLRALALLLPVAAGCIYIAQLYSTWISGGMVPPIAFANQEVSGLISFTGIYAMLTAYCVAFIAYAVIHRRGPRPYRTWVMLACFGATSLAYAGMTHSQPLARGIVVSRGEAPISSFAHSLIAFNGMSPQLQLSVSELDSARSTFSRHSTFQQGFPAPIVASLPKRPNVIVIFTEGMSARWMGSYGGLHEDLMSNMDLFASRSLVFENYFNHTAATFRGLRGQLTSGHQEIGGYYPGGNGMGQRNVSGDVSAISRVSLPEVMRANAYRSMFFLSQQEYLNNMIETLGFDRTLGRDYLFDAHIRTDKNQQRPKYLSDQQLLSAMLDELEAQPSDKPFFAALYNFQTHAFMDGEEKFGDGKNLVLNRFHTYDRDIGVFLNRFMTSRLSENTVLIITSDHSTFPDPYAIEADPRMGPHFVDTIPLIMYWKGIKHQVIDANSKNSLDLAPSLLSLLGIRDAHNLFLGCTFFEDCALDRISNIGQEYYFTENTVIFPPELVPESKKSAFEEGKGAIERYKALDLVIGEKGSGMD